MRTGNVEGSRGPAGCQRRRGYDTRNPGATQASGPSWHLPWVRHPLAMPCAGGSHPGRSGFDFEVGGRPLLNHPLRTLSSETP